MNYQKHYDALVERARNRIVEGYTEKHRIVPGCMGGTYAVKNVVRLTAEEHYVAHQLLVKIYPNVPTLINAVQIMTVESKLQERSMNKRYGWIRKRFAEYISMNQTGEGNSQFGTRWIHSIELRKSKKIAKDDSLPIDWYEGRVINFEKFDELQQKASVYKLKMQMAEDRRAQKETKKLDRIKETKRVKQYTIALYNQFSVGNYRSLREFYKDIKCEVSLQMLAKRFKTHVPGWAESIQPRICAGKIKVC